MAGPRGGGGKAGRDRHTDIPGMSRRDPLPTPQSGGLAGAPVLNPPKRSRTPRTRPRGRGARWSLAGALGAAWTAVSTVGMVVSGITVLAAAVGVALLLAQWYEESRDVSRDDCGPSSCSVHLVQGQDHEVGWRLGEPFGQRPGAGGSTVLRLEKVGELSTLRVGDEQVLCSEGMVNAVGDTTVRCGGHTGRALDLTLEP